MIAVSILLVGLAMFTRIVSTIGEIHPVASDESLALARARNVAEELRSTPTDELFASYNEDAQDDPDGPGTAPGATFAVESASARLDHPDGAVGRVLLPVLGGELREDLVDPLLGMPRDLNGDGVIDSLDHRDDWTILPAVVRARWVTGQAEQQLELHLSLMSVASP